MNTTFHQLNVQEFSHSFEHACIVFLLLSAKLVKKIWNDEESFLERYPS